MNRNIILYDGKCNLCSKTVRFVKKRDPSNRFEFLSNQSDTGQSILKRFGLNLIESNSIIFIKDNEAYQKSTAVLKILERMKSPWKYFVVFKIFPKGMRDYIYDFIAKNRYRVFGMKKDDENFC